jgi:hypothetical protein
VGGSRRTDTAVSISSPNPDGNVKALPETSRFTQINGSLAGIRSLVLVRAIAELPGIPLLRLVHLALGVGQARAVGVSIVADDHAFEAVF